VADETAHEVIGEIKLHEGWSRLLKLTIRLPDGSTMEREVEDHGAAVAVLPYDPKRRKAILARLFRAPVFKAAGEPDLLEAPAGLLEEADPAACARREAMEEVGLELRTLEPLGTVWTMPGISTERMHLFLAPYEEADRAGTGGGVESENENITIVEIDLADLLVMTTDSRISDLKTLALVQALQLRRPELFDRLPL
jgi:nudix-type nucleoside diphosphatase (YffH/AdpP family)